MKYYTVAKGSPARLVHVVKGIEKPYDVTKDLEFTEDDVLINPAIDPTHRMHEFGFLSGDADQRKKYVLVIDVKHVEVEGNEE